MVLPKALDTLVVGAVVVLSLVTATVSGSRAATVPSQPAVASSCPPVSAGAHNTAPSVRGSAKTVALTFDDGPGRSTHAIIDILRSFHVRATFFNIGWDITSYPTVVREEAADGFLLGDHTNSHRVMTDLSRPAQVSEIAQVSILQRRLTGTVPCVFRPPYGDYDAATLSIANSLGQSLWMWSDNSNDWEARGSSSMGWVHEIESAVINGAVGQNNPVVLLHNQRGAMPATVTALPHIIRYFEQRGYAFVDLLGRTGPPGTCAGNAAPLPVTSSVLRSGTVVASGATRLSANQQFALTMRADGQLRYSEVGGPTLWSSPTRGSPGATAQVVNGTLRVIGTGGQTLWSAIPGGGDADLALESDGALALVSGARVRWTSRTVLNAMRPGTSLSPGWYVSSPDLRCRLVMTASGALRLEESGDATLWRNDTKSPGGRTVLEPSGDLVTVTTTGSPAWATGTSGHPHDILTVTNQGTLRLVDPGGVIWATQ